MEYVYGAMLLHSVGQDVTEANLKKVISASGADVDNARIKALVASLEGVNIDDAIKTATPLAAAHTTATQVPEETGTKDEKKVDKKKKVKEDAKAEEEVASGLSSLFG